MQALTIIQWIGSQEYWTCSISLSLICKACSSSAFLRSRSCSLPSSLSLLKWLFVFLDTFSSNTDSRCGEGSTNPKIFGITGASLTARFVQTKTKTKRAGTSHSDPQILTIRTRQAFQRFQWRSLLSQIAPSLWFDNILIFVKLSVFLARILENPRSITIQFIAPNCLTRSINPGQDSSETDIDMNGP